MSTIVVALGGNALARRGEPITVEVQRRNVERAVRALAPLFDDGHTVVLTHGNGPQVGCCYSRPKLTRRQGRTLSTCSGRRVRA